MHFFSKSFKSHQTLALPRFHTILNGTDGQRTAMTHSWGLSWATGITSISEGWQCQTKGIKSFCGRVLLTSCLKYVAARLLLSDPPCKVSKIAANFSQSFFVVSAIGLQGMMPAVRKTQKTNTYRSNTTKKNTDRQATVCCQGKVCPAFRRKAQERFLPHFNRANVLLHYHKNIAIMFGPISFAPFFNFNIR